jgi:hypothetical protein
MRRRVFLGAAIEVAVAGLLMGRQIARAQESTQTESPKMRQGCRNARYGEVLLVKGGLLGITVSVYNSLGLNDCPDTAWKALDADQIKKDQHALAAILNGPRYFLIDSMQMDKAGETVTFGELQMHLVAELKMSASSARKNLDPAPYTETTVKRTTQYVFEKGKPVYELVAPNGTVYVMQSYALLVDSTLTMDKLPMLGDRLKLPPDWKYRVRTPEEDYIVRATGEAHVLQDDFKNTYQRVETATGS